MKKVCVVFHLRAPCMEYHTTRKSSSCYELHVMFPNPEGPGCCAIILTIVSYLLIIATFPFSLCMCIKVVQEYERAVIFRLGRLLKGGAKGPGIFFVVPCLDSYRKVDLRTVSFDVPPQEVFFERCAF
ncbi:mechanosensory protein 2-like isoform X1 [Palaemon carinicauda]|uniref:mechanosensory protein 2-like isoform X1 n=2 Tax=Palaemon carinicauda TaxID=392227 RepID=UPI0035B5EAF5